MFKKTVAAALTISALAGCSSIPGLNSATVDRNDLTKQLTQTCKDLGEDYTHVSFAVDKVSKIMVSIQDRQCAVFKNYRVLADKHADVAGFLAVNSEKTDEELLVAMNQFDEGKPKNKKIRPQVQAYKNASDTIFDENLELTKNIALQAGQIALIASQNATVLAQETALSGAGSLFTAFTNKAKDEEEAKKVPVVEAYKEMKARSNLAYDANTMISMDKDTIKQLENLDEVIKEKAKS